MDVAVVSVPRLALAFIPIAVRYQIMVMCMIFGAAELSTVCFLTMIRNTGHFKTMQ